MNRDDKLNFDSAVPGLNRNTAYSIPIKIPQKQEQQKIASILSALDDKIELNHQMNRTLEAMAQAIFKSWFVDFEFPNEEGKPYKSSGGEMVYSEELQKEIPKGWGMVNYVDIAEIQYGFPFKSELFNEKEGMPIIRIRDLPNNRTETLTTEYYDENYLVESGDVLIGMDGEFRAYLWQGIPALLNQRVCRVRQLLKEVPLSFLYFVIKRPLEIIENAKVGTTVIHLIKRDIDEIRVIRPYDEVLQQFHSYVSQLFNQIIVNTTENRFLAQIRDTLLPKLLSGEIRVNSIAENRNAQKEAPA